jgi:hypothetical protein
MRRCLAARSRLSGPRTVWPVASWPTPPRPPARGFACAQDRGAHDRFTGVRLTVSHAASGGYAPAWIVAS